MLTSVTLSLDHYKQATVLCIAYFFNLHNELGG